MKKAGLMAASLGTAALLAVGAGSVVALLADPNHGVEQANANEVNATEIKAWTPPSTNGARELAHASAPRVSDAQQIEAAARRSGSTSGVPSERATAKAIKDQTPRHARAVRGGDDDDDDWGDDD